MLALFHHWGAGLGVPWKPSWYRTPPMKETETSQAVGPECITCSLSKCVKEGTSSWCSRCVLGPKVFRYYVRLNLPNPSFSSNFTRVVGKVWGIIPLCHDSIPQAWLLFPDNLETPEDSDIHGSWSLCSFPVPRSRVSSPGSQQHSTQVSNLSSGVVSPDLHS